MAKTKPYTAATRNVIDQLAMVLVAVELEHLMIQQQFEKKTGKPFQGGFAKQVLKDNPQHNRAWKALQRAIVRQRQATFDALQRERSQYGG